MVLNLIKDPCLVAIIIMRQMKCQSDAICLPDIHNGVRIFKYEIMWSFDILI
jgi:hypothetical protein